MTTSNREASRRCSRWRPRRLRRRDSAKIGFVATFSGPAAAIGNDMRDAFELALDHLGRKVGGLPVTVDLRG